MQSLPPRAAGDDPVSAAPAGAPRSTRIWTPAFASVFLAYMLISLGLQMSNVVIGAYTDSLGAAPTIIGLVTGTFAVSAIVFKCISGPAIDSFNRKHILVLASVTIAIALVGYGLSQSVPPLFAFRLVQGAGQAFTATCCIAFIADILPREKLGVGMGVFALAPAVAQMIGPSIALALRSHFGYSTLFFVAAGVMILSVAAVSRIRVPFVRKRRFRIVPSSIIAAEVTIPAILLFLLVASYSLINPFLVIYAGDRGLGAHIGLFFTVYAATLFVSRPLAGRLSDRYGYVVLAPFFAVFVGSLFVIAFATSLWMFFLAAVLLAFGYGACQPVLQAMAMAMVPHERRGAASSTTFIGSDIGDFVGPVVGGVLIQAFGYTVMWQGMSISLVIAVILVLVLRRTITRRAGVFAASS